MKKQIEQGVYRQSGLTVKRVFMVRNFRINSLIIR